MRIADTPESWPVLDRTTQFQGRVITIRSDRVRMADGSEAVRDYVVHPGAVGIVALDDRDRILVERQYRHPVGRMLWEVPAGLLDKPGEPPLEAARRELYEEAHYQAGQWNVLVDFFNTPGSSDEAIRIFLARDVSASDGEQFEREHEEVGMLIEWVDRTELTRHILAGDVHNPTMITGVLALNAALSGDGLDALRPADAPWPERAF